MAITRTDVVYSGVLDTSAATITIGANTTFVMKGFCFSNSNAADKKVELLIDSIRIVPYVAGSAIPTGDSLIRSDLNIPVLTGKVISVKSEVATDMDYMIWGISEVTS